MTLPRGGAKKKHIKKGLHKRKKKEHFKEKPSPIRFLTKWSTSKAETISLQKLKSFVYNPGKEITMLSMLSVEPQQGDAQPQDLWRKVDQMQGEICAT